MLFGLPIIGSNFGHIGNIIEEYDCGIGVDPENLNDIVEAVKKLLTDKDVYTKMSDNSSRAVQKNFRWELMEEKLIEIYKELLNG